MDDRALEETAAHCRVPLDLIRETRDLGRFPVVNFAAGGIATPADAALMMALGVDGIFVGSGIFKSENPSKTASAIVRAVIHWEDPVKLAEISKNLGAAMVGMEMDRLETRMAGRGL
jgi:pyridoxal 5'-phosphate synthase pdxS subunit